jgi:regulator of sirC expression with transglutaminase-like and TPR domain
MKPHLPLCCAPAAFKLLSRHAADESDDTLESPQALLEGAIAVAMHQVEDIEPRAVEETLQGYADLIQSRVRGTQEQAILAHLHEFLFEELGFAGNTDDYYNPINSYVPVVLETKRGLPITLALIYVDVARRLGLDAWGVALPGHFLAAVRTGDSVMLVDPFAGGKIVTVDEAHERVKLLLGDEEEWTDEYLQPASNRHWLTRMIQNLLNVFTNSSRYADVAAMLEMEMVLWPDQHQLERDLALVLARCGLSRPASKLLDQYLQANPDDPQRTQLQQLLAVLGT